MVPVSSLGATHELNVYGYSIESIMRQPTQKETRMIM